MSVKLWDRYLTDADRSVLARGRFGQRMGFGENRRSSQSIVSDIWSEIGTSRTSGFPPLVG